MNRGRILVGLSAMLVASLAVCMFLAKSVTVRAETATKQQAADGLYFAAQYQSEAFGAWGDAYSELEDTNHLHGFSSAQSLYNYLQNWYDNHWPDISNDAPESYRYWCGLRLEQARVALNNYKWKLEAADWWYGFANGDHYGAANAKSAGDAEMPFVDPCEHYWWSRKFSHLESNITRTCTLSQEGNPEATPWPYYVTYSTEYTNAMNQYMKSRYWYDQAKPYATTFWVKLDYCWSVIDPLD